MRKSTIVLLLLLSASAWSDERILSFHSDVRVFTDGMIEVTETIQVRAEGNQITFRLSMKIDSVTTTR